MAVHLYQSLTAIYFFLEMDKISSLVVAYEISEIVQTQLD